jgi:alkylhydroperoxidase family enzyme
LQLQGAHISTVDALRSRNLDSAGLSSAERGLLEYCGKLTQSPHQATREDIQQLRTLGWSDLQIAEAVFVVGMFAMFNRIADAFGLSDPKFLEQLRTGDAPPQPASKYEPNSKNARD